MKIVGSAALQQNINKTKDALSNKVDKITGKGLSTNDYTTAEKNKLTGIEAGAQTNVLEGIQVNDVDLTITNKKVNIEIDMSGKVDKVSGKELSTNDYTTAEKVKLAGIEEGANKYVHPTYSSAAAGLYNIAVDGTGHVSNKTAVTKTDITGLGIPAQDTTYNPATTTVDGLMSAEDKIKLNAIEDNANNYIHPTYTEHTNGFYKVAVDTRGHVAGVASVTKADITGLGIPASDTNTHYESKNVVGGASATSNTNTTLANGEVYLNSIENGAVTSSHKISGTGATTVTSDTNGNIVVNSVNTTYGAATSSSSGLMSADDKNKLDNIANNANNYSHPVGSGNNHIPSGGSAGQFLKWSSDGTAIWAADNNTTYTTMSGASQSNAGQSGLVPAPGAGKQESYLRGDGTWAIPNDTTYEVVTTSADGLMSSADKVKLNNIAENANNYSHPTTSGNKHIPSGGSAGQFLKWSADGTAVWSADNNTTYSAVTTTTDGLMTADDKVKLNGIANNATADVASNTTPKAAGTAAVGTETAFARGDHVHPVQTTVSGNAGTATKLQTARNIELTGAVTGSVSFDGNADASITTTLSNFDASKITSGTIDIARLPAGALERCVVVADDNARKALTTSSVQLGDTVKVTSTGLMYMVVDEAKLNSDDGYQIYTAGSATTAGSADKATQLTNSRTLNVQDADGSNTGTGASFNGTANATIKLPSTIKATLDGNASTATKATQDSAGQQINTTYLKGLSASGRTVTYTKGDGTTGTITTQDTTYNNMGAASDSSAGSAGLVPAPGVGKQTSFLRGDGTWVVPTNTTYDAATQSAQGLMSAADKTKLDGIDTGATANAASNTTPKAAGTAAVGTEETFARGDHVHPLQTTISGNAATATKATQDSTGQQINTTYIKGLSVEGTTITYTKGDNTTGTITTQDTNTHYVSKNVVGNSTAVNNTNTALTNGNVYINSVENGAVTSAHKISGTGATTVTTDATGNIIVDSTNTTYSTVTTTANGLMSAEDKVKLNNIAENANNYSHPTHTAYNSGLYKITTNALGHVTNATEVVKADITGLGIPASDTHYESKNVVGISSAITNTNTALTNGNVYLNSIENGSVTSTHKISGTGATTVTTDTDGNILVNSTNTTYDTVTQSANGLMSASDKTKLDNIAENANNYSHPSHTAYESGLYKITTNTLGHVTGATAVTKTDIVNLGIPSADTDTHYESKNVVGGTSAITNTTSALTNGNVYLNSIENGTVTSSHKISGSGITTVTTDTSGNILINSSYDNATTTTNGLMSADDKVKLNNIAENANNYTHPTTSGNKHIPSGGSSGQILRWAADGTATWGNDNNTTYSNMTAATASSAGTSGLVPAPAAGEQTSFLRGDGAWVVPTNTTYNAVTTSANGLMTATDKTKLDGIAEGANNYTHPTTSGNKHIPSGGSSGQFLKWSADGTATWAADNNTTYSAGTGLSLSSTTFSLATSGVTAGTKGPTADVSGTNGTTIKVPKITVDTYGRVTALEEYTYTSVDNNTTYGVATTSANGLMSSTDKAKFDSMFDYDADENALYINWS